MSKLFSLHYNFSIISSGIICLIIFKIIYFENIIKLYLLVKQDKEIKEN